MFYDEIIYFFKNFIYDAVYYSAHFVLFLGVKTILKLRNVIDEC